MIDKPCNCTYNQGMLNKQFYLPESSPGILKVWEAISNIILLKILNIASEIYEILEDTGSIYIFLKAESSPVPILCKRSGKGENITAVAERTPEQRKEGLY